MILRPDRLFVRLVIIGALAAVLAGCGRKGSLDLPPGAAADATTVVPQDSTSPTLVGTMTGNSSKPVAPAGPKKSIPLDVLLN